MKMIKHLLCSLTLAAAAMACSPAANQTAPAAASAEKTSAEAAPEESTAPKSAPESSAVLKRILESKKLRVGMSGDQPPFNVLDKYGKPMGLEVDLSRALAQAMGVELEIVQKPFGELLAAVESGEVDMVMSGMTMTPERNTQVAFVGPYFVSGKAILTKDKSLADAKKVHELDQSKLTFAALAGSTSEEFVKKALPQAQLHSVKEYREGVNAVLDDKVKALVADWPICVLSTLRNPGSGLVTLESPLSFEPIGIALPAQDMHFENLVANYVRLLEGTGLLEALRERWLGKSDWIKELPGVPLHGQMEPSPL